jgi:hypothetical protein
MNEFKKEIAITKRMAKECTVIVTTSPTDTDPDISRTVSSIESACNNLFLANTPKIIIADGERRPSVNYSAYKEYLRDYLRDTLEDFTMVELKERVMYSGALFRALDLVQTPWVFVLQHDWLFMKTVCPMRLMAMLDIGPINMVRFNRFENKQGLGWDSILEPTGFLDDDGKAFLLRTNAFSDNPHFARLDFYKKKIKPIRDAWPKHCFFEEFVTKCIREHAKAHGFSEIHPWYGTYVWGNPGDPPMIRHTGKEGEGKKRGGV